MKKFRESSSLIVQVNQTKKYESLKFYFISFSDWVISILRLWDLIYRCSSANIFFDLLSYNQLINSSHCALDKIICGSCAILYVLYRIISDKIWKMFSPYLVAPRIQTFRHHFTQTVNWIYKSFFWLWASEIEVFS